MTNKSLVLTLLLVSLSSALSTATVPPAHAAFGGILAECRLAAQVFPAPIMFDGTNLYVTPSPGSTIQKITTSCLPVSSCTSPVGAVIGALVFDPSDGNAWAGAYDGTDRVWKLNPSTCGTIIPPFVASHGGITSGDTGFIDGLALDTSDNTLWFSDDVALHLHHINLTGSTIGTCDTPPAFGMTTGNAFNSGIEYNRVRNDLILSLIGPAGQTGPSGTFSIAEVSKSNSGTCGKLGEFSTGLYLTEDLELDTVTFPGKLAVWTNECAPATCPGTGPNRIRAWDITELPSQKCVPPPSGLVSWWPGDGNANDIVGSNSGSLVGGVTFAPAVVGDGFSFNGVDSGVLVNSSFIFHQPGNASIDFWMKPFDTLHRSVFWTRPDDNDLNRFNIFSGPGNIFGIDYRSPSGVLHPLSPSPPFQTGGVPIPPNEFVHIAVTRAVNTYLIYVDGKVLSNVTDSSPDLPTSFGWFFALRRGFVFNGIIDEVEVYNRTLAPSEVQSIFNAGSAGKCKAPPTAIGLSKFFTDSSFNPLPLDKTGNPKVDVVLAGGVVRSTNPGQVLAWVNVTNKGALAIQSLKVNETLPVDWVVAPPWMPAKGAIHVFFANTTSLATNPEITDPKTITVTTSNPETVILAIPNLNATAIGHPLLASHSILLAVKLDYGLDHTSQSFSSFPRNYTDTASAAAWTGISYTGTETSASASAFFIAYAKLLGDVNGDNKIDIRDVAIVAYEYGSRKGDTRWNPAADFDNDGVIDIGDVAIVAFYYGTSV